MLYNLFQDFIELIRHKGKSYCKTTTKAGIGSLYTYTSIYINMENLFKDSVAVWPDVMIDSPVCQGNYLTFFFTNSQSS